MRTPLQRLEHRVQKALEAVDTIGKVTASPMYPTTEEERKQIRDTVIERLDRALAVLAGEQASTNFKLD